MKIFFQTEKNDKDIEYFIGFILATQTRRPQTGVRNYVCLVHLLKFESDIKEHSNNKVIINFG